ncbi:MAG: DUF4988 and DUF4465 domain-containing protein [Prevotellaceae bacterium]|jgi:hypothetical protein|nr:DUF4988 and DUF4465 domain-containing protein [Prevotellaceae bacterium]
MKKILSMMCAALLIAGFASCSYDDSDLWNNVNSLEQRVKTLEEQLSRLNSDIGAMTVIVDALNAGRVITRVDVTSTGYTFTFSDHSTIDINHGTNGAPGAAAPVIGIDLYQGVYYWTITVGTNTAWLTDGQGQRLRVSGADGTSPVMGVDADGYWTVNGVRITGADGQPVKASGDAGDSFFSDVTDGESAVTFVLANGTVIVIPKAGSLAIIIMGIDEEPLFVRYGTSATYSITLVGEADISIAKPDGWRASIQNGTLTLTAPPLANTYAEKDGQVDIIAAGHNGTTVIRSITVSARDYNYVIDFEEPGIDDYLAGPTAKGENCYSSYPGTQYYGYYHNATELYMMVNEFYGTYDMWNGGIFISQWNNMDEASWENQCSVYYSDPLTAMGGHRGSKTFGFFYGYGSYSYITFNDDSQECTFDHFYVMNNTYTVLEALGYGYTGPMGDGDYLTLKVEGIGTDGSVTGTVEYYLIDFRTPDSPGILTDWARVDLLPLGKVTALRLSTNSSPLSVPAYFCFDDLALKK